MNKFIIIFISIVSALTFGTISIIMPYWLHSVLLEKMIMSSVPPETARLVVLVLSVILVVIGFVFCGITSYLSVILGSMGRARNIFCKLNE